MCNKRKLQVLLALITLLALALAVGCKGFFVNQPTALTISPSAPSLTQGQTVQFTALATFSDNSTSDVTKSTIWTSSAPCTVTIGTSHIANSTPGFATAIGTGGSVTITGIYNGVQSTATPVAATGLTISPCGLNSNGNFKVGTTQTFSASLNGSPQTGVGWSSSNSGIVSINSSSGSASFVTVGGPVTITATISGSTGQLNVTVNNNGQ